MDFNTHKKGNLMPYNGSINGSFEVGFGIYSVQPHALTDEPCVKS